MRRVKKGGRPSSKKKIQPVMLNPHIMEPILTPTLERFTLFPLKYPDTFELYLKHVASFWTVSEVDLAQDRMDWLKLTDDERSFVSMCLAFFAASDGIVNENLAERFMNEVQVAEIRQFYGFQIGMEAVHTHMYSLMIETFEQDPVKREKMFTSIVSVPSIRLKADWALHWLNSNNSFAERLVAFACVEGIFFSASFCAIYYLKKRGTMPGLTFSNELIARDEGLHRDFACHIYRDLLVNKLSQHAVHEIVSSAVDAECEFVKDALRVDLIGINATLMQQYVRCVADHLIVSLGHNKKFCVENPFEWMDLISLNGKTNFFEKRVGDYAKAGVMQSQDASMREFTVSEDF